MSAQPETGFLSPGVLPKKNFSSVQEMYEAMCAVTKIPTPVGEPGPAGEGSVVGQLVESIAVGAGQSSVTFPFDVTGSILVLVNTVDSSPSLHITAVSGSKVWLSDAAPTANYSVKATKFTIKA